MGLLKQVEGLVLRKFDYSETSLIFVLLTRECGQLRFIMKGARRSGKKKFPAIDLFRRVSIQFIHKPEAELHTVRSCELLESYDGLAQTPPTFRAAAWLSRFMEKNSMPEVGCPEQFTATVNAFKRLMAGDPPLAVCTSTLAVALDEHGLLPDLTAMPDKQDAMNYLLACAADHGAPLPTYETADWKRLFRWAVTLASNGDLHVPDMDRLI